VRPTIFEGWKGEELYNDWVHVIVTPQLGGRVMQVQFGGHNYLFVNPRYKGQYIPPAEAGNRWINYGGDKLWPLPEGHGDAEHWPGPVSDVLDDGEYSLHASEGAKCSVRLEGPSDPATGLQYSREITIDGFSPQISFHSEMKNSSDHPIRWSVQSVSQYDTADAQDRTRYNRDFWAFAPVNVQSAFVDGFHVRNGLADDPSFAVQHGMFSLHWLSLENEVWLDSDAGWIAVVDDAAKFGMIEEFQYQKNADYPGRASVIFYKSGASLELDANGEPRLHAPDPLHPNYYMEAELNSPMIRLEPGASYSFDTRWHPVRSDKNLISVGAVGVVETPLTAVLENGSLHLTGEFGAFFGGMLSAHVFDDRGTETETRLGSVNPLEALRLDQSIQASSRSVRVVVHLTDERGLDRGVLAETNIVRPKL
jgi:hypothetical protein